MYTLPWFLPKQFTSWDDFGKCTELLTLCNGPSAPELLRSTALNDRSPLVCRSVTLKATEVTGRCVSPAVELGTAMWKIHLSRGRRLLLHNKWGEGGCWEKSLLLLLLLLTAGGYVPGGSGTTIHKKHKITHRHAQNNTQHTKLQTQAIFSKIVCTHFWYTLLCEVSNATCFGLP